MKANIPVLLSSFMLVLLAAYAASSPPAGGSALTAAGVPTRAIPPTAIPSPTATATVLPQNICPVPEPAQTPEIPIETFCIEMEGELPADLHADGVLLLREYMKDSAWYSYREAAMYHMDFMSKRKSIFPVSADQAISPDGKWLAYLEVSHDEKFHQKSRVLKVASAESRYLDMSYWIWNWQEILGWVDEKHLLLAPPNYQKEGLMLLNPFTRERSTIPTGLPEILPYSAWAYTQNIYPGPGLKHLLFIVNNPEADYGFLWRMVEVDGWKTIWEVNADNQDATPVWAPDGRSFVLFTNPPDYPAKRVNTLVQVDMDGNARPLANPFTSGMVYGFSWSPDSRFLAGWLPLAPAEDNYYPHPSLVLIDTMQPRIIDLCWKDPSQYWARPVKPVWSADGKFVAFQQTRLVKNQWGYDEQAKRTMLINMETMRAYPLVNDAVPQAWMTKPK